MSNATLLPSAEHRANDYHNGPGSLWKITANHEIIVGQIGVGHSTDELPVDSPYLQREPIEEASNREILQSADAFLLLLKWAST
jgi:hypothetical protein